MRGMLCYIALNLSHVAIWVKSARVELSSVGCYTSHGWVCVCGHVMVVMFQIPAFVSRCRSTCMLSVWLCLVPSPSFSLSGFESKLSRTESRFSPMQYSLSTKGFLLRAATAVQCGCEDKQWKHQCWITSGAGLQRDPVTFDRFKTPAPIIRFPEPSTFLCFQTCNCSPF